MPSSLNADNGVVSGTAGLKSSADNSGVLDLQTNGTTAISISASQVVTFANQPAYTGGTANGVLYLNASKVLTSGSALVFDGTNLGIGASTPLKPLDVSFASGARRFLVSYDDSLITIKGAGSTNAPEALRVIGDNIRFNTGITGSGSEVMRLDSTGQLQMYNSSGTAMNALKGSSFGYSSSYKALILGSTSGTFTPCINVDPSGNASGSFSGNGGEVMFRNGVVMITPNSANNSFFPVLTFDANGYGFKSRTNIGVGDATPASSGAGITFPATQAASSDANTLDDYEEGNWTPDLTFGNANTGVTYAVRTGRYVKVGRLVTLQGYVSLTSKGSATGFARMAGLPFVPENTAGVYTSCTTFWLTVVPTSGQLVNQAEPGSAALGLYYFDGGNANRYTVVTDASINNNSTLYVCLSYNV